VIQKVKTGSMESEDIRGSPNPLEMSPEEMRKLGYGVIDTIIEHFEQLRDKPVTRVADRRQLEQRLREAIPEKGTAISRLLDQLHDDVFSNIMHLDHPRFFAYVPGPTNFMSVMADALATGFNVFSGSWQEGSGAAMIELVTIDWLRQLCGFPVTAGGLFVSGGSIANLTALAVARQVSLGQHCDRAVIYLTDQTHSSVKRAAKALGFNAPQIRILSSDEHLRLALVGLQRQVTTDRRAGMRPFCVVANAGTTNTGAVDPLVELAAMCEQQGLWLHVDAAYGGGAILCDEGRSRLRGLELADSLAIDPHKWLFQPYGIGCLLVKNARWLSDTFKVISDYGKDAEAGEEEVNFYDLGIFSLSPSTCSLVSKLPQRCELPLALSSVL
jgi:aromatic-L-amino-acid/L-tryptophan decarboxylase